MSPSDTPSRAFLEKLADDLAKELPQHSTPEHRRQAILYHLETAAWQSQPPPEEGMPTDVREWFSQFAGETVTVHMADNGNVRLWKRSGRVNAQSRSPIEPQER